ncbi:MAG: ABC transporter permease, partial [Anaerolineales bacterium]
MHEMWIIARHEFLKLVSKRSFLFATLGIPILMVAFLGIMILIISQQRSDEPIGVVDQSGILAPRSEPIDDPDDLLELRHYLDEETARSALENGVIQAYYVIPSDYIQSRAVSLYYRDSAPDAIARRTLEAYIRVNLTSELPENVANRLVSGHKLTIRSMDGSREVTGTETDAMLTFLIPFAAGFLFILSVMTSSGYLLQVVSDEKENRTIEILVTSIRPSGLIAGKTLGLMAIALAQILIWIVSAFLVLWVAGQFLDIPPTISLPSTYLLIIGLFFLPAFALIAGVMTALGGAVTELRHAQQIAGVLNLFFMIPFFFLVLIMAQPNSSIVVALTLFPVTAFATIALRWGMSDIPTWQLILSWIFLFGSAIISMLVSTRIFRAGMLQYG